MMPGDTEEQVQAALRSASNDPRVAITLDAPPIVSPESPATAYIMNKAAIVVHSMWPGVPTYRLVKEMSSGE